MTDFSFSPKGQSMWCVIVLLLAFVVALLAAAPAEAGGFFLGLLISVLACQVPPVYLFLFTPKCVLFLLISGISLKDEKNWERPGLTFMLMYAVGGLSPWVVIGLMKMGFGI